MNTQEAYEAQRKWFLESREYGYEHGECVYRGYNDCRCALGCLLPDELYSPNMEGQGAYALIEMKNFGPKIPEFFKGVESGYLMDSQSLHDSCADAGTPIEMFIENLDTLAVKYGLEIPNDN